MAKFGIALGSGPRGLGFESRYSDQTLLYELLGIHIVMIQELSGKQSFEAFSNLCEEYEKEVRECTNKLELVYGS